MLCRGNCRGEEEFLLGVARASQSDVGATEPTGCDKLEGNFVGTYITRPPGSLVATTHWSNDLSS